MTYIKVHDGKYRKVMKDNKTGEVKELILDQKERDAVKSGVHLQPYGKQEKEFFGRYKQVKKMSNGEIVNIQEQRKQRKDNEERGVEMEKDEWDREMKERERNGFNTRKYR